MNIVNPAKIQAINILEYSRMALYEVAVTGNISNWDGATYHFDSIEDASRFAEYLREKVVAAKKSETSEMIDLDTIRKDELYE